MHIINLTIECKTATGDGTKIVCMNSDYRVIVHTKDCGTFTNSPVKKLVVRQGREYWEAPITEEIVDGETVLQACLPPLERHDYVDLGVCGKDTDDPTITPAYSSTSARFLCDKSILCGTTILRSDPKLIALDVSANGTYRAGDHGADGFYEVDVDVTSKLSESRTVDLSMANGNQVIVPSGTNRTMEQVTVKKPVSLVPSNIKKGVNIGGITGTYEQILEEKEIKTNGEYLPAPGTDGFSKVVVDVQDRYIEKTVHINESFTYNYTAYADITILPPGYVTHTTEGNVATFTGVKIGKCTITIKDLDAQGQIVKTVTYNIDVVEEEIVVSGTIFITQNGVYDVTDKKTASVSVTPEGTISESLVAIYVSEVDMLIGGIV